MQTDKPIMKDSVKLLKLISLKYKLNKTNLNYKLCSQGCCIYLSVFILFSYILLDVSKCEYRKS